MGYHNPILLINFRLSQPDLDFTHLIDQDKHYISLNDVRNDLAEKVNVAKDSIDINEV